MATTGTQTNIKTADGQNKDLRDPAPLGAATAAASNPVTLATNEPLLARFPATIGQKAKAASLSVTIAGDDASVATTLSSQTGITDVLASSSSRFTRSVAIAISGTATSATVQVQRSVTDPAGTAVWVPVDDQITGNPSTGMNVMGFDEPGAAWWRVNVLAIDGGNLRVDMSGGAL